MLKNLGSAALLLALLIAALAFLTYPFLNETEHVVASVNEIKLRSLATKSVLPTFPEDCQKIGVSGVVVVGLKIDKGGNLEEIEVFESPDECITRAVLSAVHEWQFRPFFINGEPVSVRGKLTERAERRRNTLYCDQRI